jgi:hypothetical protein
MSEIIPSNQTGNSPNLLGRILRFIWRLFLLLLTAILVGAVIYFAFIQLYMNAVQTAQTSSERLYVVETVNAQQSQLDAERMDQLSKRISELEKEEEKQSEAISALEGKTIIFERAVDRLDLVEKRAATLEAALALNDQTDQDLIHAVTAEDGPLMAMKREVKLLKAMELVNRARLNLLQNNAGLARSDVESASQLLETLRDESPEAQKVMVATWIKRLGLVLENLPDYPVVAADDLEIAWRMLVSEGQSQPNTHATMTPTPTAPAVTSTPLPAAAITPTPLPAAAITPTPLPAENLLSSPTGTQESLDSQMMTATP